MQADVQHYLNLWNEYNTIEFENCFNLFKKNQYVRFEGLYLENEIKVTFDDENFSRINAFDGQLCLLGSTDLLNLFKANDFDEIKRNDWISVLKLSNKIIKEMLKLLYILSVKLLTSFVNFSIILFISLISIFSSSFTL